MKLIQLLLEYNREKTLSSWSQKIDLASKQDQNKSAEEILSHIEDIDPSINKQFVQWIVKQYVDKNLQFDDLSVIRFPLTTFQQYKNRLPQDQRDINKLTISDLFAIHDKIINPTINDTDGDTEHFGSDVKVWYNGPLGSLVTPKTEEASCRLGRGTKWCTSATESENFFDSYNDAGMLFIWRDKNGDKYQIHPFSNELKNASNKQVPTAKLKELYNHPILKQVLTEQGKIYKQQMSLFKQKILSKQSEIDHLILTRLNDLNLSKNIHSYCKYMAVLHFIEFGAVVQNFPLDRLVYTFFKNPYSKLLNNDEINADNTTLIFFNKLKSQLTMIRQDFIHVFTNFILSHAEHIETILRKATNNKHNKSKDLLDILAESTDKYLATFYNNLIHVDANTVKELMMTYWYDNDNQAYPKIFELLQSFYDKFKEQ